MSEPSSESDLNLPSQLQADLHALYGTTPSVPPAINQRVLSAARAQLARRNRWRPLWWAGAAAAAAAILLLVLQLALPTKPDPMQQAHAMRGDIDGNGKVDVLDALALARQIERNQVARHAGADLTQDGQVNRADVDAIALLAVQLDSAGGPR